MRPIVTDGGVAWPACLSVCLSVTMGPAETAALIEMPFGLPSGPKEQCIGRASRSPDAPMGRGNFEGKEAAHCEV